MNKTTIWYDFISHDTGIYHMALSELGLCYIALPNESFEVMVLALSKNSKDMVFLQSQEKLNTVSMALLAYLDGNRRDIDDTSTIAPLGTSFQMRVWDSLRRIPYGMTATYSDVARSIGQVSAVRAVASAIGANPLPIVIPCHRVIGKDGNLRGYRGGLTLKKTLVEMEREHRHR